MCSAFCFEFQRQREERGDGHEIIMRTMTKSAERPPKSGGLGGMVGTDVSVSLPRVIHRLRNPLGPYPWYFDCHQSVGKLKGPGYMTLLQSIGDQVLESGIVLIA